MASSYAPEEIIVGDTQGVDEYDNNLTVPLAVEYTPARMIYVSADASNTENVYVYVANSRTDNAYTAPSQEDAVLGYVITPTSVEKPIIVDDLGKVFFASTDGGSEVIVIPVK